MAEVGGERVELARLRVWSLNVLHKGNVAFIEVQDCVTGTMLTLYCKAPAVDLSPFLSGVRPALGPGAILSARGMLEAPRPRHAKQQPAARPPVDSAEDDVGEEGGGSSPGMRSVHSLTSSADVATPAWYADAKHVGRWRHDALVKPARERDAQHTCSVAVQHLELLFPTGSAVPRDLLPPVPCIAFDMSYFGCMNDLEVKALARQLQLCYTAVRRQVRPFNLLMCGLPPSAPVRAAPAEPASAHNAALTGAPLLSSELAKMAWAQWAVLTPTEQAPWEVFPPGDLVYLSSEAADELQDVQSGKTYIIGGLVDHKEKPSVSLARAQAHGIPTAKLPLARYVKMRKPALSTSAVVQILMLYHELGDWGQAICGCPAMHVAPLRKYVHWIVDPESGGSTGGRLNHPTNDRNRSAEAAERGSETERARDDSGNDNTVTAVLPALRELSASS